MIRYSLRKFFYVQKPSVSDFFPISEQNVDDTLENGTKLSSESSTARQVTCSMEYNNLIIKTPYISIWEHGIESTIQTR